MTYYPLGERVPAHKGVAGDWEHLAYRTDDHGRQRVVRSADESGTFQTVRDRLRCKEIWVEGTDRWRNPDDDLPADFGDRRGEHYAALRKPLDPTAFIEQPRDELSSELAALDERLPELGWVEGPHRGRRGPDPADAASGRLSGSQQRAGSSDDGRFAPGDSVLTDTPSERHDRG